jgi:ABC-type transport system involved in cytochrome c biogenesis ATPase subunit
MSKLPAQADPANPTALVTAQGLVFSYPQADLLHGLSFTITPGLSFIQGGDGRGKSTLLRLIAGALQPSAGQLHRHARTLYFEHPADPVHDQTVARAWLDALGSRFPRWQAGLAAELTERFGLADHIDKPLYMLSTGSRRKVGLVAAAASGAQLTLIDSPFAALDARSCQVLLQLLSEAAANPGRAWVMADHVLPPGLAQAPLAGRIDLGP